VKAHLKVETGDEDDLISALLASATGYLDGYAGILSRCLIRQTWRQSFGCFERHLRLPFPDVATCAVKYFDAADIEQTVDPSQYQLLEDARGAFLRFLPTFGGPAVSPNRVDGVSATMVAGYGDAADAVPAALRQAILLLIAHWYRNRAAVGDAAQTSLPLAFDALITPFRRYGA
jgi:uncharacterized phiE125 gp8 family phage protein